MWLVIIAMLLNTLSPHHSGHYTVMQVDGQAAVCQVTASHGQLYANNCFR